MTPRPSVRRSNPDLQRRNNCHPSRKDVTGAMILKVLSVLVLAAAVNAGTVSEGRNLQKAVMTFIDEHLEKDLKSCTGDLTSLPDAAKAVLYEEEIDYIDVCDVKKAPVMLSNLKKLFQSKGCTGEHVLALEEKLRELHGRHCSGQADCGEKIRTTGMRCVDTFYNYWYQAAKANTGFSDCEEEWSGCETCLNESLGDCRANFPDLSHHLAEFTGLTGSVCDIVRALGAANK